MNNINMKLLKIVLILVGIVGIVLGIDFGLGGIETLGWQGSKDFIDITDTTRYGVQDSNFRFFGGVIFAIGIFIIFAVQDLPKYQQVLKVIFGLMMVGGMARFTSGDFDVIFSVEIISALAIEVVLMAIVYVWLTQAVKSTA